MSSMFDFDDYPRTDPKLLRRLQESATAYRASQPPFVAPVEPPPPKTGDAPEGKVWVCGACGKRKQNKYDFSGSWDESCALNASLVDLS